MTADNRAFCVIGASGSGKSLLGDILREGYGYNVLSLSSGVRRAAQIEGLVNPTREDLQLLANRYRAEKGDDIFAKMVTEDPIFQSPKLVLEGARHPGEIQYLQQTYNGVMRVVGIVASLDTRFHRVMNRTGKADAINFETFRRNDERENGATGQSFGQNNAKCFELADDIVENEWDSQDAFRDTLLAKFGSLI